MQIRFAVALVLIEVNVKFITVKLSSLTKSMGLRYNASKKGFTLAFCYFKLPSRAYMMADATTLHAQTLACTPETVN